MSSLATNTTSMRLLTGGLPNAHQDTFPSILFLVLFTITAGASLRRLARYRRPTRLLLALARVQLFEAVRVATCGVRLAGTANLRGAAGRRVCDAGVTLVQLAGFHADRGTGCGARAAPVFTPAMAVTLMGAIALGAVAGTKISKAQTDTSAADSVKTMRTIASAVVLIVLGLLVVFCGRVFRARNPIGATSAWLAGTSLLLMIIPIFRLVTTAHPPADSDSTGAKAAFYLLQITVEWMVGASLLVVDAKEWCGIDQVEYTSAYQDDEAQKLAYASGSF